MKNFAIRLMIFVMLLGQTQSQTLAQGGPKAAPSRLAGPAGPGAETKPASAVRLKQMSDTGYGRVTVGKPKIWSFDRINSTLDGLLRDLDAVQLASLAALDASESNQALLDFLTTSLTVKGDFNQKAATVNALELEKINALRPTELRRLQAFNEKKRQAEERGVEVDRQLAEARDRKAKLDPKSPDYEKNKEIEDGKIKALTDERTEIAATLALAAPSLTGVDKTQLETTSAPTIAAGDRPAPSFSADDFKDMLKTKLGKDPSLPATKKLDNFITLLHERLSRQLSISFDDNSREGEVYLVQFDVGIYPRKNSEDHVLRVEFDLEQSNDRPLAYDLYPGASSYNITEYWGKSKGTGIVAGGAFLFGLGLSAEYKRQRDQVRNALTQSVYIAGFGAGTSTFGWHFAPNPSEKLISPGNRTAYAVIVAKDSEDLKFTPRVKWAHRAKGDDRPAEDLSSYTVKTPNPQMTLTRLAYQTQYSLEDQKQSGGNGGQNKPEEFGTIQLTFREPIDPNLVITVNGAVLPRLRDARGRATAKEPATTNENNRGPKNAAFGLLETDDDNKSHWFALGAKSISLKLARFVAGSEVFPRIRLLSAGNRGTELLSLLERHLLLVRSGGSEKGDGGSTSIQCAGDYSWEVLINDWKFKSAPGKCASPPASAFVPLFSTVDYIDEGTYAWFDSGTKTINVARRKDLPPNHADLDERTQVVLIESGDKHTALNCHGFGKLSCIAPDNFTFSANSSQIAVERPARNGKIGIADKRFLVNTPPEVKPKALGEYAVIPATTAAGDTIGWRINLPARNLDPVNDEIEGFGALPPSINPPTFLRKCPNWLQLGSEANYHLTEDEIEFWIPAAALAAVRQSRLYLRRGGKLQFYLPEMAPKLLPAVTEITKDAGWIAIKGTGLGLVDHVILRGCGSCRGIKFGVSDGLISFAAPERVKGVFPIVLRLKHGNVEVEAAKPNKETWSLVLAPEPKPAKTIASAKTKPTNKPPQPDPAKKDATEGSEKKEEKLFLLSPPPPEPVLPSGPERRKQTTVQ